MEANYLLINLYETSMSLVGGISLFQGEQGVCSNKGKFSGNLNPLTEKYFLIKHVNVTDSLPRLEEMGFGYGYVTHKNIFSHLVLFVRKALLYWNLI